MLLALDVSCWLKIMSKVQWIVCNINGVWSHKTFHDKMYDHLALVHPASNHKTGHPLYVYCMISVGSKFRIPEINHVQFDIWLTIMSCRTPSHWYSCPYIAITLFYQLACFLHWSLLVSIHSSCSANDLDFLPCLCLFILNGKPSLSGCFLLLAATFSSLSAWFILIWIIIALYKCLYILTSVGFYQCTLLCSLFMW